MGSSASVRANSAAVLPSTTAAGAFHAVQKEQQPGAEEKEQDEVEFASLATQSARGLKATTFGLVEFCPRGDARTPIFGSFGGEGEGPPMQPRKGGPHGDDHEAWMQQLLWFQPDTFADTAFQRWEKNQKTHPLRQKNSSKRGGSKI
ncbi:unnamed protein product [Polarella glacialis]|uniref:Uncharacterized protein n=1 Tax=Polarella glacialis TaxID=89957 RepID=A0A813DXE4_POLGL|nr:unnamed protein product [Polarella glacialis]